MDHQQGFVVGVCRRRRKVDGSRDHYFPVHHGEFVVWLVAVCEMLRANRFQTLLQPVISSVHLAGVIRKADPQ